MRRLESIFTANQVKLEYIYQLKGWPAVDWDHDRVDRSLAETRNEMSRLIEKVASIPQFLQKEVDSCILNMELSSSWALADMPLTTLSNENLTGLQAIMDDAAHNSVAALTEERIFRWHRALFPTGRSGPYRIKVGAWRDNPVDRPLEVFVGEGANERVAFEAPPSFMLSKDMFRFTSWFNTKFQVDPLIKCAIAHVGFVTIHPLEDGNGRMARLIALLQLSRAIGASVQVFSMSAQLEKERKHYLEKLEQTQKGDLNVTEWLLWFLQTTRKAILLSEKSLAPIFSKAKFWEKITGIPLNSRQIKMINALLDGLDKKLTTTVWGEHCGCSQDTALRDIQDLLNKKIVENGLGGGRSTNYVLRNS